MIDFNIAPYSGNEIEYMMQAVKNQKICGDVHLQRNVISGLKNGLVRRKCCLQQAAQRLLKWQPFYVA